MKEEILKEGLKVLIDTFEDGVAFDEIYSRINTARQDERIGRIAHCQIMIEHFLAEFLLEAGDRYVRDRTWANKVAQAMYSNSPVQNLRASLEAFGRLRNGFAHTLDFKPEPKSLDAMRNYCESVKRNVSVFVNTDEFETDTVEHLIETYAGFASATFAVNKMALVRGEISRPPASVFPNPKKKK